MTCVHVGSQTVCTVNSGAVKLDSVFVNLLRLAVLTAVNHLFLGVDLTSPAGSVDCHRKIRVSLSGGVISANGNQPSSCKHGDHHSAGRRLLTHGHKYVVSLQVLILKLSLYTYNTTLDCVCQQKLKEMLTRLENVMFFKYFLLYFHQSICVLLSRHNISIESTPS